MLCVSVALVVACVLGPCWRWGVGSWAIGDAPRACLVCGRRWLYVGEVPVWWVWPPTLGVGCWVGVGARDGWRGCPPLLLWYTTLLCSAVLCAACRRVLVSFIVCLCQLWRAALRCVLCCLRVVRYVASVRRGGHGTCGPRLPGQGRSPRRGRVRVISEALG